MLLTNARTMHSPASPASVHWEAERIVGIYDNQAPSTVQAERLDAAGKLALPGFVNAHTHLAMVAFRGLADDVPLQQWLEEFVWPMEQRLTPEDVYWCTLLAIAEGIRSGSTTFIDMYIYNDEIARAVEESGVRALLSYGIIAEKMDEKGQAEIATTQALAERWHGAADGRLSVAVAPHAVYTVGKPVWQEALHLARDLELPLHTHVSETRGEVENWRSKTNQSPVQYLSELGALELPMLAAHCVHVDAQDIGLLSQAHVTVAHCPKSNAKLGSGIAPVSEMLAQGVRVALGTDGASSNNRLDMFEELRAAWQLQRAAREDSSLLPASAIVEMATQGGREIAGAPKANLEVGDHADLVLLETQALHSIPTEDPHSLVAYAADRSDVTDVVVNGQILMRDRELRTIDENRVKSEVRRLLRRLNNE